MTDCEDKASGAEAVKFTTFVLSLSTAALQQLGLDVEGRAPTADLPMARQTIDILAMLQDKTQGNLSEQESKLLGNVLYDLRMRYVAKVEESCAKAKADKPS